MFFCYAQQVLFASLYFWFAHVIVI